MTAFMTAWPTGDSSGLARFFSEDAVFHNGSLEPVRGQEAIVEEFARQMRLGGEVNVDIRHTLTDGTIVMVERVDYVKIGDEAIPLPIMGIFEVHEGVIRGWRDYFDSSEFRKWLVPQP